MISFQTMDSHMVKHFAGEGWIEDAFTSQAEAERVYQAIDDGVVLPVGIHIDGCLAALMTLEKDAQECRVITCVGEQMEAWLDEWMDLLFSVAREHGCSRVRVRGRPGWLRKLKGYGFKPNYVDLVAQVEGTH